MKIPESIRIGGMEYAVISEPYLSDGGHELMGQIRYQAGIIALSENNEMCHEVACITLWHEILHGLARHFDLEMEDEETVVDAFARGVYQVLQDNGGRLFDLKEVCTFEKTACNRCFDPATRGGMQPDGGEC